MVEDHLYHIGQTLDLLAAEAPGVLPLLTVVCLDRPGPDTRHAVGAWLERHPEVWIAAAVDLDVPRFAVLEPGAFDHLSELARVVGALLRPGGLLLQDIKLETLAFIPRERWWESIYLATTVRGMFAERPPRCRFLSNKPGPMTFGRDLVEAGFDPRDVLDKDDLGSVLAPTIERFLERALPFELRAIERGRSIVDTVVGPEDRRDVEGALDLVFWRSGTALELGGRAVAATGKKTRLELKDGSTKAELWSALVGDLFAGGPGLPVLEVGRRVAPEYAGRAEMTNCAARHIFQLRSALSDGDSIRTVEHAYRLDERLRVGCVEERRRPEAADLLRPPRSRRSSPEVVE